MFVVRNYIALIVATWKFDAFKNALEVTILGQIRFIGLSWSRDAEVFIRGETLSAPSDSPKNYPDGWTYPWKRFYETSGLLKNKQLKLY